MMVKVKLLGTLPALLKLDQSEISVDVLPGSTLRDVMKAVSIQEEMVMIFQVRGQIRTGDFQPDEGDEILLIPPVAGG